MAQLIHQLIEQSAHRSPDAPALSHLGVSLSYRALSRMIDLAAAAWQAVGLGRSERLAVYLEKREEAVVAMFGASAAGGVFVPVNPILKPGQVAHILNDCGVRVLVTSRDRLDQLSDLLAACPSLHCVVVLGAIAEPQIRCGLKQISWHDCMLGASQMKKPCNIDADMAAILYTSGSTGKPKGVVLSHRNLISGALSVAQYLDNRPEDRVLCVLPLSFDYGLSQLTTAFSVGACAVLMNHLLLRDIVDTVVQERITGLAAVPPLWIQLSQLGWRNADSLRYITNSGGAMQGSTISALREALPHTRIYLMYGLTEAFRSTYLAPDQLDRRPNSIGKAIPNAEVLVVRPDGSRCEADEPGELVHRGALVAMGYWNDPQRTAERFRPLPPVHSGLPGAEIAVWSGDTVRADDEGYLYFVGRSDEMIKTSGYRVSPTEVEEAAYACGLLEEASAVGVPHPVLGQAIVLVATTPARAMADTTPILAALRHKLPSYMVPVWIDLRTEALPRNPNGKIDRRLLAQELADRAAGEA